MNIDINLLSDWEEYLRQEINTAAYSVAQNDGLDEISYKFFNLKRRKVSINPRKLYESKILNCPEELQTGYQQLKDKFIRGEDVTPHLSKSILNDNYEDFLLNDWGIHHFHLGRKTSNRFTKRTGPLLFALINDSNVYCIDIKAHGAWTQQSLIKTIHNEWPDIISTYLINGIKGLSVQPTDSDIAKLRKAHVNTFIQIEDNVIYGQIGGGYSSAGTSVNAQIEADSYYHQISNIENHIKENHQFYMNQIPKYQLNPRIKPLFKLLINDKGFHVQEMTSKVIFTF